MLSNMIDSWLQLDQHRLPGFNIRAWDGTTIFQVFRYSKLHCFYFHFLKTQPEQKQPIVLVSLLISTVNSMGVVRGLRLWQAERAPVLRTWLMVIGIACSLNKIVPFTITNIKYLMNSIRTKLILNHTYTDERYLNLYPFNQL